MTEREAFEPRLHDAVHRYAERVTTEIDAAAFAHAVATGAPRGRGLASLLGWRVALGARPAWLLLVAALILALLAAAVWVGSRPRVAAWQRVELPVGGSVHDITAMPSGYLAVGEADGNAAAWTSPDCLHWTPASTPEKEWKQSGTMSAVIAGGPGFVAVGRLPRFYEPGSAAVWTSPDGRTWALVPGEPVFDSLRGTDAAMTDIATLDGRLVAVGWSSAPRVPAIWVSEDGFHWQQVGRLRGETGEATSEPSRRSSPGGRGSSR